MLNAGRRPVPDDREAGRRRADDRAPRRAGRARVRRDSRRARHARASNGSAKGVAYADTVDGRGAVARSPRAVAAIRCAAAASTATSPTRGSSTIKAQVIADAFARIGRIALPAPVTVAPSPEDGYRMRARLHVRGDARRLLSRGHARAVRRAADRVSCCRPRATSLDRLMAAVRSIGAGAVSRDRAVREHRRHRARVARHLEPSAERARASSAAPRRADRLDGRLASGGPHVTDTIRDRRRRSMTLRRHVLAFFQGNRYLLRDSSRTSSISVADRRRRCSISMPASDCSRWRPRWSRGAR